jgi:hypothetical protein
LDAFCVTLGMMVILCTVFLISNLWFIFESLF